MGKTAKEAGWHISRYNLSASLSDGGRTVVVNLYSGICLALSPLETYLLSIAEELDEEHPVLKSFAKRGLIVNFDERAVIESCGRAASVYMPQIGMTVCPTMACNFDCSYCFEHHRPGRMSGQVQEDVINLAGKIMKISGVKNFSVSWFGGEPLLQPDIIKYLSERLISLCEELGVEYSASIITNGYLLNRENVEILEQGRVRSAQITLDGIGETHNATRHLVNGGPTYDRIMDNLRTLKIPFPVYVRHNVHRDNLGEFKKLDALIRTIARESGNEISCYPAPVSGSNYDNGWESLKRNVCGSDLIQVSLANAAGSSPKKKGHYCSANNILSVCVDDQGSLYKCWEDVAFPERSFATASGWDPGNPFDSATNPDMLTAYINTAVPNHDPECWDCRWLPLCVGGCPHKRLADGKRNCLPYKNMPEEYVLARYRDMKKKEQESE